MNPLLLQKQLRDNSNDLMSFCADLKQWGEEMKQKEGSLKAEKDSGDDVNVPLVRKKSKEDLQVKENTGKRRKRIKGFDYSAWEKYDVEAECAKVDAEVKSEDEDSGDLTDECDETIREEAIYHKEKGNKFVKKESWNQAIECYTKAIECYAYDPIFYANRALCHLKNLDYRLAESDCTTAIQLDKTYVKAYHRRAQAREALNQLNEAHDDLLKVFDYEADNKESKIALAKLEKKLESVAKEACNRTNNSEQRPKSKFTLSRQQHKAIPQTKTENVHRTNILNSDGTSNSSEPTNVTYWPSGNNIELVTAVNKAPHLRSKKPLRRINIKETNTLITPIQQETVLAHPLPSLTSDNSIIKCDEFKVVERKIENFNNETMILNDNKYKRELIPEIQSKPESFCFEVPETSVQFNHDWKILKNKSEWRYLYLKQIQPKKMKEIFNESLEYDVFSGIVSTLSESFINENVPVYEYLVGLTEVKRFSMLVMFMTDNDKEDLLKLIEYMKSDSTISRTNIDNVINKYNI